MSEMEHSDCPFCDINQADTKYYSINPFLVVIRCNFCNVPVVVLNRHTMIPTSTEKLAMVSALSAIADRIYGVCGWKINRTQKIAPGHVHWHAEAVDGTV